MLSDRPNENLRNVLQMCEQMLALANKGDEHRQDAGCGVVFGTLRDVAYKVRGLAEKELDHHTTCGKASAKRP